MTFSFNDKFFKNSSSVEEAAATILEDNGALLLMVSLSREISNMSLSSKLFHENIS